MGKPVAGEIVVLPFPQTDLQAGKRRPALVVVDLPGDDLILCQITSQAHHDSYSIPLDQDDFQRGRLHVRSYVRPNRLFTVEQSVIRGDNVILQDALNGSEFMIDFGLAPNQRPIRSSGCCA